MKTRVCLRPPLRGLPALVQATAVLCTLAGTGLVAGQGLAPVAQAAATAAAIPRGALDQGAELVQQAARHLAPPGARVRVSVGQPDARLRLAPCASATAYLLNGSAPWGSTRFGVRCTQGATWNIQVPAQVQAWAPAVVAAVALPAGASLTGAQLVLADTDWAAHPAPPAAAGSLPSGLPAQGALFSQAAELEERKLSRPLSPGAPVRAQDLHSRQWFAAGQTVSLVALGDGFAVASEGQALSPGLEGQLVRVRTESGRVVTGYAVGQRRVEIRL